ncbi:MAG: DUF4232 domain-containing protein [Chloroflexota bacterium]
MTGPRRSLAVLLAVPLLALAVAGCTTPGAASSGAGVSGPRPTPSPPPASPASPAAGGSATRACEVAHLAARITQWEGAAGHRIATVELRNTGTEPCAVPALMRPQLLDATGAVVIDGAPPAASETITVPAGGVLTTLVQDGNYCRPAPPEPVTVAFVLPTGGRIVASNESTSGLSGVPPCSSDPGSNASGDIEMQPWRA